MHATHTIAGRRLEFIDALRGFACLGVLIFHAFGAFECHLRAAGPGLSALFCKAINLLVSLGYLGVHLFLVVSGFCLFYPIASRCPVREIMLEVRPFLIKRARRVLPPYYVALAVCAGLAIIPGARYLIDTPASPLTSLPLHVLMLHNLLPSTLGTYNGSFWSLALECQLYLIFPILVWLGRRGGMALVLASTFCVAVVWQFTVQYFGCLGTSPAWEVGAALFWALPGRSFEFAAGMAAAALIVRPRRYQTRAAAALSLVCLLIGATQVIRNGHYSVLADQFWGIGFAAAIVVLARVPAQHFTRSRSLKALTWLGTISYSVYLVHQPLMKAAQPLVRRMPESAAFHLLFAISVGLPITIGTGYLFFLMVERRCIRRPVRPESSDPILHQSQTGKLTWITSLLR